MVHINRILHLVIPRVLPAQQSRAILLGTIHQLLQTDSISIVLLRIVIW